MELTFRLIGLLPIYFSFAFAQGENYILFSATGDTLMTRTSCYCKKEDTLSSYFVVLKNNQSNLSLLSVFTVEEPHKNSIPCADFKLVSSDTLSKYRLIHLGKLGVLPKRKLHITSKIVKIEFADSNLQGYRFKRTIRHQFKIGRKTFHVEYLHDVVKDIREPIIQPRIKSVFGNRKLKRYYLMIITEDAYIHASTRKKHTTISHQKILK